MIISTVLTCTILQGGNVPIRKTSNGLLPLPAWKSENLWQGYLPGEAYHSIINPPEGFVATANNHIQDPKKPVVATFSALSHRVNRFDISDVPVITHEICPFL